MPVFIISGDEEFELNRRVRQLKESLLDPAWAQFNFSRLTNAGLDEIVEAAATLPFGPGNRVILIDRCELFTKKRSGAKGADDAGKTEAKGKEKSDSLEAFEAALAHVAANTYLIFACPFNFDSTLKTSKAAAKHATMEKFEKERYYVGSRHPKLEAWCRKEAKQFGATIEDEAISYLLDGTEADLRQVSSELDKAAVYMLPARHITYDAVVKLSPFHSHVFVLADKWIHGKTREALASAEELLARQSAMPIIAAMQTMLSKWIYMRALCDKYNLESPAGPGVVRRELPFQEQVKRVAAEMKAKPYAVELDLKRITKVPTDQLVQKRIALTRLEDLIKSGQLKETNALQIFLAG